MAQERDLKNYVEPSVDSLTKTSILCSTYVIFHSLILAFTKRFNNKVSASVFEVIVPLVFGTITIFLAVGVFATWEEEDSRTAVYYYGDDEYQNFPVIISIFLSIWFAYLRVGPLVRLMTRRRAIQNDSK